MGDKIDENVWEGEAEVDLSRIGHSDDEAESSDYDSDTAVAVEDKKSKKKRKFDAMKEKKRLQLADASVSKDDQIVTSTQLTPAAALHLINVHRPTIANYSLTEFQESDFFYPDLEEASTTESKKGTCKFVRALSASLPSYRKVLLNNEDQKSADKYGCPILLIVCASAQRATEIIKSVSSKLQKCKIAKLFAKHFKLEEQLDMLAKEYYSIAIGTPNRLSKLIELGGLSLRCVKVILVDITEDAKHYDILTLHEVKQDFYKLLHTDIHANKTHLKIALINDPASSNKSAVDSNGIAVKKVKKPYVDKNKRKKIDETESKQKV